MDAPSAKKIIKKLKRLIGVTPEPIGPKIYNRVEIFGSCPAKCPFCHSGIEKYTPEKVMPAATFEEIVHHLRGSHLLTPHIYLYDRGEPFCHPEVGTILDICRKNKLNAYISTNASKIPALSRDQWDTIRVIKVSLSGITESSYRKIYGLDLQKTLANIETISGQVNKSKTKLSVNWLRYKFNADEEKAAKTQLRGLGFIMDSKKATLIQIEKVIAHIENKLPESERKILQEYLIQDEKRNPFLSRTSTKPSARSSEFICEQWNQVIVNWDGELLKCCGLSPDNAENRLGRILNMDYQAVKSKKRQLTKTCKKCISYEIAKPSNKKWEAMWNF